MKNILKKTCGLLAVMMMTCGAVQAAETKTQRSSLAGQVHSVAAVGTIVKEGTVLVTVKTLVGTAPAARANCNGKVVAVQVAPGNQIKADQIVALVEM